jgi:hypothetical protein
VPVTDNAAKAKVKTASGGSLLGGLKGRSAAAIFYEEFPPELRPTPGAFALDVAMVWGDAIIEAGQFHAGQVKIGAAPGNQFQVYFETVDSHTLVTLAGPQAKVVAPAGGKIVVRRNGKDEEAGAQATIGLEERARVKLGAVEFVLRFVKPQPKMKAGMREQVDLYFTKVLSIAVMAHIALLAALIVTPLDNTLLSEDLFKQQNRYTKLILKAPEKKKAIDLSKLKKKEDKEKEIEFGKKMEVKQDNKKGPQIDAAKREADKKKVMAAGLLGAMGSSDGAASNIFGGGGLGTGINNALGGLQGGTGLGDAHGVGGLGSRGAGFGGGGGGLGLGGLGTKGGGGKGYGFNLGSGQHNSTRIIPGKTTVVGGLSKDVIGKVIRKHWNEIKYCYEKELQKDPNLEGKVAMMFVIDGTGHVSEVSVQQDTTNNGQVADCMANKIKRWIFPEPQGGGQVVVTYPWIFRAAGGGEGEGEGGE